MILQLDEDAAVYERRGADSVLVYNIPLDWITVRPLGRVSAC